MSREKIKNLSIAELVQAVRSAARLSYTDLGFRLRVSETAIRHYEAGRREPDPYAMKRLAAVAPPELRAEIEDRLPPDLKTEIWIQTSGRRFKEETVVEAHTALDLVLDNAASEVVKKLQEFLGKHAAQWRDR